MSEITVYFGCGHAMDVDRHATLDAVACQVCGERRVRNIKAPAPTIRATDCAAEGPHVQQEQ